MHAQFSYFSIHYCRCYQTWWATLVTSKCSIAKKDDFFLYFRRPSITHARTYTHTRTRTHTHTDNCKISIMITYFMSDVHSVCSRCWLWGHRQSGDGHLELLGHWRETQPCQCPWRGSEVNLTQLTCTSQSTNILDGKIHNCWILLHKEIILIEPLQVNKVLK